jgi:hypothetical protein
VVLGGVINGRWDELHHVLEGLNVGRGFLWVERLGMVLAGGFGVREGGLLLDALWSGLDNH